MRLCFQGRTFSAATSEVVAVQGHHSHPLGSTGGVPIEAGRIWELCAVWRREMGEGRIETPAQMESGIHHEKLLSCHNLVPHSPKQRLALSFIQPSFLSTKCWAREMQGTKPPLKGSILHGQCDGSVTSQHLPVLQQLILLDFINYLFTLPLEITSSSSSLNPQSSSLLGVLGWAFPFPPRNFTAQSTASLWGSCYEREKSSFPVHLLHPSQHKKDQERA